MAISEACGLWIQQRLEEEIDQRGDTMASVTAIAKMVAEEVNRIFESDIKPESIRYHARKISNRRNLQSDVTTSNNTEKKCNKVQQINTIEAVNMMDQEIEKGETRQVAAHKVAKKTGKNEGSLRVAHQREEKKRSPEYKAAMLYAEMAIAQLESIQKTHHDRQEAFDYVIEWINKNRQ